MFGVAWGMAGILYLLSPLPWPEESRSVYLAILIAIISFSAFAILGGTLSNRYIFKFKNVNNMSSKESHILILFLYAFTIIGALGSILTWAKVISFYGIGTYLFDPSSVRYSITLGNGPIGSLTSTYLMGVLFAGVLLGAAYVGYFNKRFLPGYLPLIVVLSREMAILGRWKVIAALQIYVAALILGNKDMDGRIITNENRRLLAKITSSVMIAFVFIIAVAFFKQQGGGWLSQYSDFYPPIILELIQRLNVPVQGLSKVIMGTNTFGNGKYLLNPLVEMLSKIGIGEYPGLAPETIRSNPLSPQFGQRFMAISDLGVIFADFGWKGLFWIPALAGFITSFIYKYNNFTALFLLTIIYVELAWFVSWNLSSPFYAIALLLAISVVGVQLAIINLVSYTTMNADDAKLLYEQ